MRERQPSKKPRVPIDMSQLSPADRVALERVAALLHKSPSDLWDENPYNISLGAAAGELRPAGDVVCTNSQPWSTPTTQWEVPDGWQQQIEYDEMDSYVSHPNQPWTRPSGVILESHIDNTFNQWSDKIKETVAAQLGSWEDRSSSGTLNKPGLRRSPSWSHQATSEENWLSVPTDFLTQTSLQDGMVNNTEVMTIPKGTGTQPGPAIPTQDNPLASHALGLTPDRDTMGQTPRRHSTSSCSDLLNSNENEPLFGLDWEEVDVIQVWGAGSQRVSPEAPAKSGWSLIELPKAHENFEKTFLPEDSNSKCVRWVSGDADATRNSSQKPQRRGPFLDQHLREETSNTRKLGACLRCKMQRIRCLPNSTDPNGPCQTCQAVSKQKIHTLPCARHKLTDCIIYRTGKAPGLEFTFRWPVMRLRDISEWADTRIRTIKVISDVCPVPLELSVRKFVPIPQDSLHKSWMDGKVKKFKETTPYAIVNMSAAVKDMGDYINNHIFKCMAFWLEGRDTWVQETYRFARRYMLIAPAEEQALLGDTFRLWFAIRRTATTEHIVGDDTLDMAPETKDTSFPLFGKVPLPPVMIQQLDMILTLGFLQPLRKKFFESFQKIILAKQPKSWMTIYLITFISLHSCAAVTAEHYRNARKHGLKRRYAMPNFIAERHHSANVYLSYYHYCTKPCNPFTIDWRVRQTTPFAEMTTDEIHFLIKTSEMVDERKDKIRNNRQMRLQEDELFFLSQMFEEEWTPRDTFVDYGDETISGGPIQKRP